MSKVSTIIRTIEKNRHLLDNAIESAINQKTSFQQEIIIVSDGGIEDRTSELQKRFDSKIIRYFPTNKPIGRSAAANLGLEKSEGQYIGFLDDDDILYDNHIETIASVLERDPAIAAAYAGADKTERIVQSGQLVEVQTAYHFDGSSNSLDLLRRNLFPIQAVLFRSSILTPKTVFSEEMDALEDWLFWQRLLVAKNIAALNVRTSKYYVPHDKESKKKRLQAHIDAESSFRELSEQIRFDVNDLLNVACKSTQTVPKAPPQRLISTQNFKKAVENPGKALRVLKSRTMKSAPAKNPKPVNGTNGETFRTDYIQQGRLKNIFEGAEIYRAQGSKKSKTVVYTSINAGYLSKALVLGESLKRHNPDVEFHIVYADVMDDEFKDNISQFPFVDQVFPIRELDIQENLQAWIFKRQVVELCTSIKPHYMNHLLKQGYKRVIYVDPDCRVYSKFTPIFESIDKHSLSLTPHCKSVGKSEDQVRINELSSLAHGVFNLGYIGVKNDKVGKAVADYWTSRCDAHGFDEIQRGTFTDQKFMDMAPIFFEGMDILKHSGVNLASWNIEGTALKQSGDHIETDDGQLVFFHFSGFDKGVPGAVAGQLTSNQALVKRMIDNYDAEVTDFSRKLSVNKQPFALNFFVNNAAITLPMRICYRKNLDLQKHFPNPFETRHQGTKTFYDWINYKGYDWLNSNYDFSKFLPRFF